MYNIEADIEGTPYFQKDGVESRQLYLDGLIKIKNSYVCYCCKIPLKPANVEKKPSATFKVRPHFKKKNIDHLNDCVYYEVNSETHKNTKSHYENINDSEPIILKVPEFDLNSFEIIKNIDSKLERTEINKRIKNDSELIKREAKTSYNKLSFFANKFLEIDHKYGKDYKSRDDDLKSKELYISSISKKDENNYYNYIRHAKTVNEDSYFYHNDYMRVFWSYIGDKVIEQEDRFECYVDDNRIFRIYKNHITKGLKINKRNIFLYTIPKQDETGRFIFNSIHSNLTSILPYVPKG